VRTVAIVLAAGESKRLGRPKQLIVYDGEPLVRRAVRVALGAGCDETIVVVQPGMLDEVLRDLPVTLVDNDEYRQGMSTSIARGIAAAGDARVLITLCDQPLVTSAHLRELLSIDAPIVATEYNGLRGVPAVFARPFAAELCALRGDRGARAVIAAHGDEVQAIRFEDAAVDIDTDADL
jgi:molybdenum cofactor cytidylyltransferase